MLISFAFVVILGLVFSGIFKRFNLPPLLGYLTTGLLLSSFTQVLDPIFIQLSPDFRELALIVILFRAGLNMNISQLSDIGRPAILLSFVPACFEIAATFFFAPIILGISKIDALLMGSVLAAVSPAVVVPKMLDLQSKGYGTDKGIPQLIMAGASVDDIFVIILFTALTGVSKTGEISLSTAGGILSSTIISIISGIVLGCIVGLFLSFVFNHTKVNPTYQALIALSFCIALVFAENAITFIPISGFLGVIAAGVVLLLKKENTSKAIADKFSSIWSFAEILLFVYVGLTVDIKQAVSLGFAPVILIFAVLIVRLLGVFFCLVGTGFSLKKKAFCMIAYMPKATVQAAIGSIPLSMGLSAGKEILTVAVLSILITAPLGAVLMDRYSPRLLERSLL